MICLPPGPIEPTNFSSAKQHTQHNIMRYNSSRINAMQNEYNAVEYITTQHNTTQYMTMPYSSIQYNEMQHKTLLFNTIEYDYAAMCHLTLRMEWGTQGVEIVHEYIHSFTPTVVHNNIKVPRHKRTRDSLRIKRSRNKRGVR